MTNCLITRCESKLTSSGYPQGSGIAQHGGLVTDCRFIANRSTGWQNGVGIYIDKGVCERSVFTGNPRIIPRRGVVDVGCYESPLPPATVIFLK